MADFSKGADAPSGASEAAAKSEMRKARLEAFRAERAAKRAASLGLKTEEPKALPPKQPKAK